MLVFEKWVVVEFLGNGRIDQQYDLVRGHQCFFD
jgi:hypothetical protein